MIRIAILVIPTESSETQQPDVLQCNQSNAGWQRGRSHRLTSMTECITVLIGCSSRGGNDYDQFCFH